MEAAVGAVEVFEHQDRKILIIGPTQKLRKERCAHRGIHAILRAKPRGRAPIHGCLHERRSAVGEADKPAVIVAIAPVPE